MIRMRRNIIGCIYLSEGDLMVFLLNKESEVFKKFTGIVVLWLWSLSPHLPLL